MWSQLYSGFNTVADSCISLYDSDRSVSTVLTAEWRQEFLRPRVGQESGKFLLIIFLGNNIGARLNFACNQRRRQMPDMDIVS